MIGITICVDKEKSDYIREHLHSAVHAMDIESENFLYTFSVGFGCATITDDDIVLFGHSIGRTSLPFTIHGDVFTTALIWEY